MHAMLLPNKLFRYRDEQGEREVQAEAAMMSGPAETKKTWRTASRRLALPCCPRCDEVLFASTAAEFVSKSHVRHQWSCDSCGHEFSTSVQIPFERAAA